MTSVRPDGARTARELVDALSSAGLVPRAIVVNRALSGALVGCAAQLEASAASDPRAASVIRYALAQAAIAAGIVEAVRGLAPTTALVPDARGLDGDARLASLTQVGEALREGLAGNQVQ